MMACFDRTENLRNSYRQEKEIKAMPVKQGSTRFSHQIAFVSLLYNTLMNSRQPSRKPCIKKRSSDMAEERSISHTGFQTF